MENIISGSLFVKAGISLRSAVHKLISLFLLANSPCKLFFNKAGYYKSFFLINLFLLVGIFKAEAQQNVNSALYANIIYRFTKYINWPGDKKSGDFVIGIVGDLPLYDEIKNFTANKTVGTQKIIVKQFSGSSSSYNCQMLFIGDDESGSLKKIVALTKGAPILLISESNGRARKGSCINFIILDERLKLEINTTNIEDRHLDIASELLSLGIIIK